MMGTTFLMHPFTPMIIANKTAPGLDNLLSMTVHTGAIAGTYYAVKDHLGTVHALTDGSGTVVESYRFDAWGNVLEVRDAAGSIATRSPLGNRYLWQGREYDWQSGWYYFRARWYDPRTGRWLSNDPIGISGGLNQYVFCGNDPVNRRDPFGLSSLSQQEEQFVRASIAEVSYEYPLVGAQLETMLNQGFIKAGRFDLDIHGKTFPLGPCLIYLNSADLQSEFETDYGGKAFVAGILVHELFHCYQYRLFLIPSIVHNVIGQVIRPIKDINGEFQSVHEIIPTNSVLSLCAGTIIRPAVESKTELSPHGG